MFSLGIIFLALPYFGFGIWFQAEPVIAALHVCGGIAALGLALLALSGERNRYVILHPFAALPFAVAVWSLLSALFLPLPRQSWFGSGQIGEGVLWYFDLAVLTAAGLVLMPRPGWRKILAGTGAFIVAILTILNGFYFKGEIAWFESFVATHVPWLPPIFPIPYYFPDYLAFFSIYAAALVWAASDWRVWLKLLLCVGLGLTGIWFSDNRVAVLLAFGVAPALWAILALPPWGRWARMVAVAGAILVPVGLTAAVNAVPPLGEAIGYERLGLKEGGTIRNLIATAESRHHLAAIAIHAIGRDPKAALIGSGWGSFTDLLALNLPVDWVTLRDDTNEYAKQSWDAVIRVDFHSHNYIVEAFLSAGPIAAILALAMTAALPFWSRRKDIIPAALTSALASGTAALWFQFAAALPFMALTYAAYARPIVHPRWGRGGAVVVGAVLTAMAGFLIWGGATSWRFAEMAFSYQPPMQETLLDADGKRRPCPSHFIDQGRGGDHLGYRLRVYVKFMINRLQSHQEVEEGKIEALRGLICASEDYIDHGANFRLISAALLARSDLAFVALEPMLDPLVREFLSNWEPRLIEALAQAPKRTDLAVSYMLWLLRENRTADFERMASWLHARNANDAVGLWFSGVALLNHDATAHEGIRRMKRSLELGIERIMPVEDEIKTQLRPG